MKSFVKRLRVLRRIRRLEYAINRTGLVEMAWLYELAYIQRTGKLDWINPNLVRVRAAGSRINPPPRHGG